jgi:O-antigen/teichoic acid export membrane protein
MTIPLSAVQKIQAAFQDGYKNNLWQLGSSLVSLGAIIVAVKMKATLPTLVLAISASPLTVAAANSLYVIWYDRPYLRPQFRHFSLAAARELLGIGSAFTVLSLSASLAFASDNLVISHILGPVRVPEFAVPARLFGIVSGLIISCQMSLWPAYGEAAERGDVGWIRRTLARSLWAGITVSLGTGIVAVLFMPTILRHWLGPQLHTPLLLVGGLALWMVMQASAASVSVLLNGLNVMKPQIAIACVFTPTCILLKILLTQSAGLPGTVCASLLSYFGVTLIPYCIIVPRVLEKLHQSRTSVGRPPTHRNPSLDIASC